MTKIEFKIDNIYNDRSSFVIEGADKCLIVTQLNSDRISISMNDKDLVELFEKGIDFLIDEGKHETYNRYKKDKKDTCKLRIK